MTGLSQPLCSWSEDRGHRVPRFLSGEVVSLTPKPQACARQINNPHQTSPQVTQTSEGSRAEEGWGTCREFDTLWDALCLGVEEMRTRLRQPCLSCKHDLLLRHGCCALIRHFLPQPEGPQLSPSKRHDVDVTRQLTDWVDSDWKNKEWLNLSVWPDSLLYYH